MVGMRYMRAGLGGVLALVGANIDYWLTIAPAARRELERWQDRAQYSPDPVLRAQALKKLSSEGLNPRAQRFSLSLFLDQPDGP